MKSENRDRADHPNQETVDTVKALIEVYKSAFGDRWEGVFSPTVKVGVSSV